MASKKFAPTISKQEFDAIAPSLRAELKQKFDASKSDSERPPPNPATKGAFGHIPALDSKTVATWSPVVKKHLGARLDPRLIRKGGYASFDDCWSSLSAKLRASCPDAVSSSASQSQSQRASA